MLVRAHIDTGPLSKLLCIATSFMFSMVAESSAGAGGHTVQVVEMLAAAVLYGARFKMVAGKLKFIFTVFHALFKKLN